MNKVYEGKENTDVSPEPLTKPGARGGRILLNGRRYGDYCTGCSACEAVCGKNAIRMTADAEGFFYPVTDQERCVHCGRCERVCPSIHPQEKQKGGLKAAIHKDTGERSRASSGGAFFALAQTMFDMDDADKHNGIPAESAGVVCGAVYTDRFEVVHRLAERCEDVRAMQGSKYVAGRMDRTAYIPAEEGSSKCSSKGSACGVAGDGIVRRMAAQLHKGRHVLCTGTPCQIAGVRAALKELCTSEETERLILADIMCHGVPSPRIWQEYLRRREKAKGSRIIAVNFRNKERGWSKQALELKYEDGSRYLAGNEDDPYYILYFKNVMLRPSCYTCPYACRERISDLTLGDYWGNEDAPQPVPEREKGVSLILVNTERGRNFLAGCKGLELYEGDEKSAYQPLFDAPTKRPVIREAFWQCVEDEGAAAAIRRYGRLNAKEKLVKKVIAPITKWLGIYKLAQKIYFTGKK